MAEYRWLPTHQIESGTGIGLVRFSTGLFCRLVEYPLELDVARDHWQVEAIGEWMPLASVNR